MTDASRRQGVTHTVADEAEYCRHMAEQSPSWSMGDSGEEGADYYGIDHARLSQDQRESIVSAGMEVVVDGDADAAEWLMSTLWARVLLSRAEREACERLLESAP